MLPYQALQLGYAAVSFAITACLWRGFGRIAGTGRPVRRWALTLGSLCAILGALHLALRPIGHTVSTRFIAVAIVFYAGGFWLPVLLATWAARARGRPTLARSSAWVLAAVSTGVSLYAMLIEPNRLQFREEVVPIAAWPAGTTPLLVAHLSDIQTVGPCAREEVALAEVARRKPDLIVVTGDYVGGPFFDTGPAEADARNFLSRLGRIAPTIVVAGHSENDEVRARVFEGLGLIELEDEARELDFGGGRKLRAIGLDPYKPDLRLPREPRPPGVASLLVTHSPDVTQRIDGMGVDLHVAGHTHGGQIVVPLFGPPLTLTRLPRRYARGLFRFGDHWLDVCAGLGMEGNHAPRIRLFCPPEISMLRLVPAGARAAPASE